jgi:acetyltransferase-like isoleucine patch superfamily enzyme
MNFVVAALRRYGMSFGMAVLPFSCTRVWLLRLCGVRVGGGCYIGFNVICDTNFAEMVSIGDNVTISHNTSIFVHTMTPAKSHLARLYSVKRPVRIESGSWIGANCTILPGVTVGADCMVGAGSVVSKSTEPCCLYAGNPCRKIKVLPRPDMPGGVP